MSVTIKDIAKIVGVASQNVSSVLRGNAKCVSAATREKILRTAQELGYSRNISAQILRGEDTRTIAILSSTKITCITDEHVLRIIMHLLSRFNEEHYACFFAEVYQQERNNLAVVKDLVSRGVKSFVLIGSIRGYEEIEVFLKNNACSYIQYNGFSDRRATVSMKSAVRELWSMLSDTQKMKFKVMTDPGKSENIRINAFQSLDCDFSSICYPVNLIFQKTEQAEPLYVENGYHTTEELMKKHPETEVIMYHSDYYMEGGMQYFHEHGYAIGKDILLIGVNYSNLVRYSLFPLWSIQHPEEELIEFLYGQVRQKEPISRIFEMQLRQNPAAERMRRSQ